MLTITKTPFDWYIGGLIGGFLFAFFAYIEIDGVTQKGNFHQFSGRLYVVDDGKKKGNSGSGFLRVSSATCYASACKEAHWKKYEGVPAVALVDEVGKSFEIWINGRILLELSDTQNERYRKINTCVFGLFVSFASAILMALKFQSIRKSK